MIRTRAALTRPLRLRQCLILGDVAANYCIAPNGPAHSSPAVEDTIHKEWKALITPPKHSSAWKQPPRRGERVEFVKESLIFTGEYFPMANLKLLSWVPSQEFERSLIKERQREGIARGAVPTGLRSERCPPRHA